MFPKLSQIFLAISKLNLNSFLKIILIGLAESLANTFQIIKRLKKKKEFKKNTDKSKIVLITGGSRGIGKQIVKDLINLNYNIHIFARDTKEMYQLKKEFSQRINFSFLDLKNLKNIKSVVDEMIRFYDDIFEKWSVEYVICNSGVYYRNNVFWNDVEMNLLVNHIGHHVFTQALLFLKPKRFVFVSSSAMFSVTDWHYKNDVDFKYSKRDYLMTKYSMSKLANSLYVLYCKNTYLDSEFVAVHPGMIATKLFNNTFYGKIVRLLKYPLCFSLYNEKEASYAVLYAVFSNEISDDKSTLDFFMRGYKAETPQYLTITNAEKLMAYTEKSCKKLITE